MIALVQERCNFVAFERGTAYLHHIWTLVAWVIAYLYTLTVLSFYRLDLVGRRNRPGSPTSNGHVMLVQSFPFKLFQDHVFRLVNSVTTN